jgi:hypothetical protein
MYFALCSFNLLIQTQSSREWQYTIDNEFATALFRRSSWNFSSQQPLSNEFCVACNDILGYSRLVTISEFRTNTNNCQLCRLLLSALERVNNNDSVEICILREGSALKIKGGPRLLRICSDSGMKCLLITFTISNTNCNSY